MAKSMETNVKVGLFICIGLVMVMASILFLGSNESLFNGKNHYYTHFETVDGLIVGAKTMLAGVPVGIVDKIELDQKTHNIRVRFSVEKKSTEWVRKDSTVEIATQGVLGDKYLSIRMGSEDQSPLAADSEIPNRPGKDITQFLHKGDQLLVTLNSAVANLDRILKNFEGQNRSDDFFRGITATATHLAQASDKLNHQMDDLKLKSAINNLNQIFEKVNNGTGTIGALINDPGAYDALKALLGGANRNRIIRNLVRQTIKDSEEAPAPATSSDQKK